MKRSKSANGEQIQVVVVEGINDAIRKMGTEKFDSLNDMLRAFAEATTLADTYWEMLRLYTGKNEEFVDAVAKGVRQNHEKMVRLKERDGRVEVQIRHDLMPH